MGPILGASMLEEEETRTTMHLRDGEDCVVCVPYLDSTKFSLASDTSILASFYLYVFGSVCFCSH
jgi:hypothetical protein